MAYDKVVDSAVLDAGLKQIADAIREKGGTSGNLAFPAAMADAIAAIEAGGGAQIAFGSITPSAATGTLTVEHGLGVIPSFVHIFMSPGYSATARANGTRTRYITNNGVRGDGYVTQTNAQNFQHAADVMSKWSVDENVATATAHYSSGNAVTFVAGVPYNWICIAYDQLVWKV